MGLHANDLIDLVEPVFEIDSYQSKMGNDADIMVLSFTVLEKGAADDLVKFVESGYSFVLDADATTGEQSDGYYRVYVEIEREVSVVVNADSKEQAEEHAMDLFVENPNEQLLLNRVVGVTEEEDK